MEYDHAKFAVCEFLSQRQASLATNVRRYLACRIMDERLGRKTTFSPESQDEREAAQHVRKMIAEGEINEHMSTQRLYYSIPTTLS